MNKKLIADIKQYVSYLMLPLENLYYHQYEHALAVMERAIYLWTMEGCNPKEIELLAIASLFHDTWFVIEYEDNEQFWAKIAQNYLKTILYPEKDIKIIENIILATKPDSNPHTLLEQIIKDADLDNLWTEDFFNAGEKLKREREMIQRIKIRDPDWKHAALNIASWHKFYTKTQISEREAKLKENIEKLKAELGK